MITELVRVDYISSIGWDELTGGNTPENTLPRASYQPGMSLVTSETSTVTKYVRFP